MKKRHKKLVLILIFLISLAFTPPSESTDQESPLFSKEELSQILAPIALYPDALLAQIMMASTYPLEVVQANQWLSANQSLSGAALDSAVQKKDWDPSVKALTQFPSVLSMMGQDIEWATKLGDAFLAQQKDIADTVQTLRAKARAEGNLENTKEQTIVVEKEMIIIQSAQPEVIYVPSYNSTVVYGRWYYPAYPPVVVGPPPGSGIVAFGLGVAVGAALDDDWGWHHHHWDWHHGGIDIDINRKVDIDINVDHNRSGKASGGKTGWEHDPKHRKGAAYRDKGTSRRFGQSRSKTRESRSEYRGYSQQGRAGKKQTPGRTRERAETGRSQTRSSGAFSGVTRGGSERLASERGQYSRNSGGRGGSRSSASGSRKGNSGASRGGGRRR